MVTGITPQWNNVHQVVRCTTGCVVATATTAAASAAARSPSDRDNTTGNGVPTSLRFALLLYLQLLAKDGCDFTLHERPRYRRVGQRALFPTRTVHFRSRALSLDALPAAGEAELVMPNRRTLHEVGILQSLLANGALECRVRCRSGCRSSARWCITRGRTGRWWKPTGATTAGDTEGTVSTAGATARYTSRRWHGAGVRAGRIRTGAGPTESGYTVRWRRLGLCLRLGR